MKDALIRLIEKYNYMFSRSPFSRAIFASSEAGPVSPASGGCGLKAVQCAGSNFERASEQSACKKGERGRERTEREQRESRERERERRKTYHTTPPHRK